MSMKGCRPIYYDRFRCIAGACKDSCCIGWEIDVDDEKREYYQSVSGELGERLRSCIDWQEGHFILQGKEERCPFLNTENLCDLIIGLGEESLCEICREHPRFYDWYDDYTEAGLGLCCEEAARLLLESEDKLVFMRDSYEDPEPWINVLFAARETAFTILQDRNCSVWERLYVFSVFTEELQDAIEFGSMDEAEETTQYYSENTCTDIIRAQDMNVQVNISEKSIYEMLLRLCEELEPIDETWPEMLRDLKAFMEDEERFACTSNRLIKEFSHLDFHYEHLTAYIVYRYFMKAREDSNIRSKGMLAVFGVLFIRLLDLFVLEKTGEITSDSRAWNAKMYSKEIEYSEDNLEKLENLFWQVDFETFFEIDEY